MTDVSFALSYINLKKENQKIDLKSGEILFILGANGSGKSALIQKFSVQNGGNAKRISAHRQIWFAQNFLNISLSQKNEQENHNQQFNQQLNSRWQEANPNRSQIIISNLINEENNINKKISDFLRASHIKEAEEYCKNNPPPLEILNELLAYSNIPIKIFIDNSEKIFASKNSGEKYSIAELSDGERNALFIASEVLTAKENQIFFIDEPERHLHRSIISPLLLALFQKRQDCAFVIATHDIELPLDSPKSKVLMVRDCIWQGTSNEKNITAWDADLIESTQDIDISLKQNILGAKRIILFVEGEETSLDKKLYQILFPNISVIAKNGCDAVKKVVKGIRESDSLHWIQAFGLIDRDSCLPEELEKLKKDFIYILPCYAIESIYYNKIMIEYFAEKEAEKIGCKKEDLIQNIQKLIDDLKKDNKAKTKLCAFLCQKKIEKEIKNNQPSLEIKHIIEEEKFEIPPKTIELKKILDEEKENFDKLDMYKILMRYPLKKFNLLNKIAFALKFIDKEHYENAVIQALLKNIEIRNKIKDLFNDLVQAIEGKT